MDESTYHSKYAKEYPDLQFIALAFEYVKTKDIKNAINFAQECTTAVVQKTGVATI